MKQVQVCSSVWLPVCEEPSTNNYREEAKHTQKISPELKQRNSRSRPVGAARRHVLVKSAVLRVSVANSFPFLPLHPYVTDICATITLSFLRWSCLTFLCRLSLSLSLAHALLSELHVLLSFLRKCQTINDPVERSMAPCKWRMPSDLQARDGLYLQLLTIRWGCWCRVWNEGGWRQIVSHIYMAITSTMNSCYRIYPSARCWLGLKIAWS